MRKKIKNPVQQQRFNEIQQWLKTVPYNLLDYFPVKISQIEQVDRYKGDIYLYISNQDLGKHTAILSKQMLEDNLEHSDRFYQELQTKIAYIHKYHIPI